MNKLEYKVDINEFKQSIYNSNFTYEEIAMLLDFYVTCSLASTSGLSIGIENYGWNTTKSKENGYGALENEMAQIAEVEKIFVIKGKSIDNTLKENDLFNNIININKSKIILQQNVSLNIDEKENIKITQNENRIECLFRHIRNSFAHGNTYFFDNQYLLLEDKDGKKITARILIKQKCLLDWIKVVDKDKRRYFTSSTLNILERRLII